VARELPYKHLAPLEPAAPDRLKAELRTGGARAALQAFGSAGAGGPDRLKAELRTGGARAALQAFGSGGAGGPDRLKAELRTGGALNSTSVVRDFPLPCVGRHLLARLDQAGDICGGDPR